MNSWSVSCLVPRPQQQRSTTTYCSSCAYAFALTNLNLDYVHRASTARLVFKSGSMATLLRRHATNKKSRQRQLLLLLLWGRDSDDDEDDYEDYEYTERGRSSLSPLRPETSFGSEAVPEGQRPVNEYLNLLRQPLFDWAVGDDSSKLVTRLGLVYLGFFALVCYPIAGATFTDSGYLVQKLAASNVGALGVVLLLVLRLYAGWSYVGDRLTSTVIEYEETGWFDGDLEQKSLSEQKRDKFLYQTSVQPVVQRLQLLSLATAAVLLASVLGLNVVLSWNPIFDEYNPDILERLPYDEKLANKAALKSGGRPTYCDSRYYRALAGGSGCN